MRSSIFLASAIALAAVACSSADDDARSGSTVSSQSAATAAEGKLAFAGDTSGITLPSTAKVRVVDASLEDAPSIEVATGSISLAGPGPHAFSIPFTVKPNVRYVVQAHVDVDGDGQVSKGDFITMESYPVFNGYDATVDIEVKRVD